MRHENGGYCVYIVRKQWSCKSWTILQDDNFQATMDRVLYNVSTI